MAKQTIAAAAAPKATRVETAEFRRASFFSTWLRRRLKAVIIPRADAENREAYLAQFDDASRNVEIAIEGLGRLIRHHPQKSVYVLRGIGHWLRQYFGAQRRAINKPRYLVYTQLDKPIPFVPAEDILYTYMIAQIAYVTSELAGIVSARQMGHIARGFIKMNSIGVQAFDRYPTLMPRFLDHDRLSLKVVQRLDKPLNCCPSLHIAYSLFLDGVGVLLFKPQATKREVFESVRFSTIGMFNSVLYSKQHSILDVAFGMLCARLVFEQWFDQPFDDFVSAFPSMARDHPIPYEEIAGIYEEACAIQKRGGSLAETLGTYLRAHGYQRVEPDEEIGLSYFDTVRKRIVRDH